MTAPSRALTFFDAARAAFAAKRVEHYRYADRFVRIASSDGFDFVHRAFAHLHAEPDAKPELDICVWEKPPVPSPPWSTDDYGPRGEIRGFNDARFRTAFDHIGSSLSMLDRERSAAIFWTREAGASPQSEQGAPLKTILHWWLEDRENLFVHAGAIGNEKGAVLLAGGGGAGKSTTAILCARNGMRYLADDYCAVKLPDVFSLYGTGKIARGPGSETKELIYMNEDAAIEMRARLPLRAILLPRINSRASETDIRLTSASDALKALAPSTISQLSGAGAITFQRLAHLARALPCFELSLARDFDGIPQKIRTFLDEL